VMADITARDRDGELMAVPTEWDEAAQGPAPRIRLRVPRRPRRNEAVGVGDRALLRIEVVNEDDVRYSGRVIKAIDRAKQRVLGIFHLRGTGGAVLIPIEKKRANAELVIPPGAEGQAQDGD